MMVQATERCGSSLLAGRGGRVAGLPAGRGKSVVGLATGSCGVEARREEEAMVTPSLTKNDAVYAGNPLSPEGSRRFEVVCSVGLPGRWLGHRLRQAALDQASTRRNQTHHAFTTAC